MKEYKTIDEQIELLKSRGLIINDEDLNEAKDFLMRNNYYRISGYSLTLRKHDVFYPGVTMGNIIDIYNFDREMRNLLLWAIEIIEVNAKSIYAHLFSKKYGGLGYLDSSYFTDAGKHAAILAKSADAISQRLNHEAYLQHYINDLKEDLPLWAFVDLLTISDISILYQISDEPLKKEIALQYKLTHTEAPNVLSNFLHGMTIIRNLCAHDSRIFNRLFVRKPDLNKKERLLLRRDKNGQPDNSHLFGYILIIKRMLSAEEFATFKARLVNLHKQIPFVNMRYYGFPDNWERMI